MIRITNLTDRDISISKNAIIKSRGYLDVHMSVDSRLYQLVNMNLITIQEISEKKLTNNDNISEGELRRKQIMERIENGQIKPSVPLNMTQIKQTINNKEIKPKRIKKSK